VCGATSAELAADHFRPADAHSTKYCLRHALVVTCAQQQPCVATFGPKLPEYWSVVIQSSKWRYSSIVCRRL
jgi:hypothetical protein